PSHPLFSQDRIDARHHDDRPPVGGVNQHDAAKARIAADPHNPPIGDDIEIHRAQEMRALVNAKLRKTDSRYLFHAAEANKSSGGRLRGLSRSVPRGTVNCARGEGAFMSRTISRAGLLTTIRAKRGLAFGGKFCAPAGQFACITLALVLCALASSPARAANWFEKDFWLSGPRYSRVVPACD